MARINNISLSPPEENPPANVAIMTNSQKPAGAIKNHKSLFVKGDGLSDHKANFIN